MSSQTGKPLSKRQLKVLCLITAVLWVIYPFYLWYMFCSGRETTLAVISAVYLFVNGSIIFATAIPKLLDKDYPPKGY
jgi:hypothetical protein